MSDTLQTQPTTEAERSTPARIRQQAILLTVGCATAALLCLVLWGATRSVAASLEQRQARAVTLAADARAIVKLRRLPEQAAEVGLPQSDLLERVSQAMQKGGLKPESLASTLPQAPRKLPGSDHAEVVERLVFEDVRLEPLTRFCHALTASNPALRISAVQLRAGRDRETWNADVSVSHWILAPQRQR